jgi:hypothetical protein
MKRYALIADFSGAKFAARYGLNPIAGDFFVDGDGMLVVPDNLPDDPPIQETVDSPTVTLRNAAISLVDGGVSSSEVLRGTFLVLVDELNNHALKINSILDAVDAATSLADLKTRIVAIADYPQRTPAQAKQAIKDKITGGGAD